MTDYTFQKWINEVRDLKKRVDVLESKLKDIEAERSEKDDKDNK